MKSIKESQAKIDGVNELVDHLTDIIESNDERYSFEFSVCGIMEVFDKRDKVGYLLKVEPIEYDKDGNMVNLDEKR